MIILYSEKEHRIYLKLGDALLIPKYDSLNEMYVFKVCLEPKDLIELGVL